MPLEDCNITHQHYWSEGHACLSIINPSVSLPSLSPSLFFFPEFYNSAVRNCFWLKLGSKSLISGQELSPSPPDFLNPFLLVRFKLQKSRAEGEGSVVASALELAGSGCFHHASAALYFSSWNKGDFCIMRQGYFCVCVCV